MRYILSLAWKNLSRYKKRTAITALSISVGLAFYIIMDSMITGSIYDSVDNLLRYETGAGTIETSAYWNESDILPLEYSITPYSDTVKKIETLGLICAPRTSFAADLIVYRDPFPEDGSIPVTVTALDTEKDTAVFDTISAIEKGRFPLPDEDGIAIGSWLAEDIGADTGFPVTLVTRSYNGYYQVLDLEITGIINTTNPFINRGGLYIRKELADEYLDTEGTATDIFIKSTPSIRKKGLPEELPPLLSERGLRFYTWQEMVPDFVSASEMDKKGSSVMLLIIFVIVAVGISNTMLMAIFERTRETGMMRALGMSDNSVKWLFRTEAAGIGLIGSAGGLLLGAALNILLVKYGIDYSWMMRDGNYGYRMIGIMKGIWHAQAFAGSFLTGTLLSFLVSFIPTRRAVKLGIPACIRDSN